MKHRRKYGKQFKVDAVNLLENSDKTATAIAEDLGIPRDALCRWRRELRDESKKAFTGQRPERRKVYTRGKSRAGKCLVRMDWQNQYRHRMEVL